jgi:hypothetical protein
MGDKPMTKAARKHHIKTAGQDRCPYCKAENEDDNIEYEDLSPVEDGDIESTAHCLQCGRKWIDIFRLADVREIV